MHELKIGAQALKASWVGSWSSCIKVNTSWKIDFIFKDGIA